MCGLFGFLSTAGEGPDVARLRRIAAATERRGHHAFGLAWIAPDGRLRAHKRPGAATANLGDLARCRHAPMVVGHCRWATHGSPADNGNNHPHRAGRGLVVHNGVVRNYTALAERHRLRLETACDTEVLGRMLARTPGTILERAVRVVGQAEGPLALLGLWADPARLLLVKHGNPLWFGEAPEGFYFGSLSDELPGRPLPLAEAFAAVFHFDGDRPREQHARIHARPHSGRSCVSSSA